MVTAGVEPGADGRCVGEGERLALLRLKAACRRGREAELLLFRERLLAAVRSISPLLIDVAAREGLSPDGLARGIRLGALPSRRVPWVRAPRLPWSGFSVWNARSRLLRSYGFDGRVVRYADDPAGGLAVRVRSGCLDVCASVGPALLATEGSVVDLWLPPELPATLLMATIGRPLDDVVGPSLLSGRGSVVRAATEERGLHRVTFEVPVLPYRLPWRSIAGAGGDPGFDDVLGMAVMLGHSDPHALRRRYAGL